MQHRPFSRLGDFNRARLSGVNSIARTAAYQPKTAYNTETLGVHCVTYKLQHARLFEEEKSMAWTTPILVEICVGLEINGYLPAEL